nr:hypothetical protein [Providencia rettgeri]
MRTQEIRKGDLKLTRSDVSNAIKILYVTKEPKLMYEYLESKGDRYAKLANSVVKGDSLSGAFALNYLDEAILARWVYNWAYSLWYGNSLCSNPKK